MYFVWYSRVSDQCFTAIICERSGRSALAKPSFFIAQCSDLLIYEFIIRTKLLLTKRLLAKFMFMLFVYVPLL